MAAASSTASEEDEILRNMVIPEYLLAEGEAKAVVEEGSWAHPPTPKYPVLVFINSKSGGQRGRLLFQPFKSLLTPSQVYDLHEIQPMKVLHNIINDLEKLSTEGDKMAAAVRENLRIIVAGGDGTVAWLLGVIGEMKLWHPPPVAPVPLGTGNNLPYTFGWGRSNIGTDLNSVKLLLIKVARAKAIQFDSWLLTMKIPSCVGNHANPVALPHGMQPLKQFENEDGWLTYSGKFWNYFSMGMDAQVAYAFHRKRELHPERFGHQLKNEGIYASIGCSQGWFCVSCFHRASRSINRLGKITFTKNGEDWEELDISPSIRSIVMLNLPSFAGGLNPWGDPSNKKSKERGLTRPYVNDGLLEIVGFQDGWHGLALLSPKGHGTRLAQAHKVRIQLSSVQHTYMRMDGEPWLQPLPTDGPSTLIEMSHQGQALVLATEKSMAETYGE